MASNPVKTKQALFIKLGHGGSWEKTCIDGGFLRLGYHEVLHDLCESNNWELARAAFADHSDSGSVTRHINQVKLFYEAPEDTIWITFYADSMWWCRAHESVELLPDGSKKRNVVSKWSNTDITGKKLLKSQISGKLLAVQAYRGTICAVSELDYLLHKINGTLEPHVEVAQESLRSLIGNIVPIIKNLHFKDFETLIDLIFRQAGWQRTGVSGETEKDIDLDLISPITKERIAVQVKAKATLQTYNDYKNRLGIMDIYSRRYFVTHTPNNQLQSSIDGNDAELELWTPEIVAKHAVCNGLVEWLLDKAA